MKKIIPFAASIVCIFFLTACTATTLNSSDSYDDKSEDEATVSEENLFESAKENAEIITPTGYQDGQVQRPCVFYNGKLYVEQDGGRRERTALKGTLTEVAKVKSNDNYKVPSEELVAAQMKEGTAILLYSEGENRLFIDINDEYIWQLIVYSYPPETLGPVSK